MDCCIVSKRTNCHILLLLWRAKAVQYFWKFIFYITIYFMSVSVHSVCFIPLQLLMVLYVMLWLFDHFTQTSYLVSFLSFFLTCSYLIQKSYVYLCSMEAKLVLLLALALWIIFKWLQDIVLHISIKNVNSVIIEHVYPMFLWVFNFYMFLSIFSFVQPVSVLV